jgi:tetratricopeptide (TPR) repeat protein
MHQFLSYILLLILSISCASDHSKNKIDINLGGDPTKRVDRQMLSQCLGGDDRVCYEAGKIEKARKRRRQSYHYFEMSCNLNYGPGCYGLGVLEAELGRRDLAYDYFVKSCRLKEGRACYELAALKEEEKKLDEAHHLYNLSCEFNLLVGCKKSGIHYFERSQYKESARRFSRACKEASDYSSCFNAGLAWVKQGQPKEARAMFSTGCDNLNADACYNLAILSVRENQLEVALSDFKRAFESGFSDWPAIDFDLDLKGIRGNSQFLQLVKEYRPPGI